MWGGRGMVVGLGGKEVGVGEQKKGFCLMSLTLDSTNLARPIAVTMVVGHKMLSLTMMSWVRPEIKQFNKSSTLRPWTLLHKHSNCSW